MNICFAFNPTSWDLDNDRPWPGGMADVLSAPIIEHLPEGSWTISRHPLPGHLNVYFSHRNMYNRVPEPGITSVFAGHGIADKAWRNASRTRSQFRYQCVSGPAWTSRLVAGGMPASKILEVGYPKLDSLFAGAVTGTPKQAGKVRVVYAPTHGGGGERSGKSNSRRTSWWQKDEIVAVLDRFDVVVAPHPRHRDDKRATLTEYVDADVVIADGGSTIYEAWALDLPVVFCDWLTKEANIAAHPSSFEAQLYRDRIGYHAATRDELADVVDMAAEIGITEPEAQFIETIFPRAYRGCSGRMHAEAILDIANRRDEVRHTAIPRTVRFRQRHNRKRTIDIVAGTRQERRYASHPSWEQV